MNPADARHVLTNLLHGYVSIADSKDVEAVVEHLGDAQVSFPHGDAQGAEELRAFFSRLWSAPASHRHDVTNLVVEPGTGATWTGAAYYTRWVLDPDPVVATLGGYRIEVDPERDTVLSLTVSRLWTRP